MRAIYNGVDLMPLETHYFDWETVYDEHGVDYLYTKVSFAGRFMINGIASVVPVTNGPQANYGFDPKDSLLEPAISTFRSPIPRSLPNLDLTITPGDLGVDVQTKSPLRRIFKNPVSPTGAGTPNTSDNTHKAIRHRLTTPRGVLYVFWGSGMESGTPAVGTQDRPGPIPQVARLFLESPELIRTGHRRCDAKNGPFPRLLSITHAYGDAQTLVADWGVETYVIESSENFVKQTGTSFGSIGLISNRFSQTHSVDTEGYTTITTTGQAVFRTDMLFFPAAEVSPDQPRPFLFMPIPHGFVREIDYVRGREDVTGVEYAYHDTQVKQHFVAGPYTRAATITINHVQSIATDADIVDEGIKAYERILNIKTNRGFVEQAKRDAAERAAAGKGGAAKGGPPPRRPRAPVRPAKGGG